MRPTDENQAASTRPNLMSSRRGAGEENILAMLERDSARRPGSRMSGVRLASYGAAAALAGILAGGVAWLAYDHRTAQELEVQHDLANVASPPAMADLAPPPSPPAAVTAPAPAMDATLASAPPPLVMLPPHEVEGAKPAPAPPAAHPVAERVRPAPGKAEVTAPKGAARSAAEKKADKPPKLASRAAGKQVQARARTKAKARPDAAARPRKAAAAAEAPVDSDVALISAIIAHSERHRSDRDAAGACSGPQCPPKPQRP